MTNTQLTTNILQDLQNVQENLLGLSDNIWLEVDHNNNESFDEFVAFKRNYNNLMQEFSMLSNKIASAISQYADINVDEPCLDSVNVVDDERERIIQALDQTVPHTLDEDFTYKRPCAVKIDDQWYINTNTWKNITLAVTRHLYAKYNDEFLSMINNEVFIGRDGQNNVFSYDKNTLRSPVLIKDNLYIETNSSANDLIKTIRRILSAMDMNEDRVLVYLREDRDA